MPELTVDDVIQLTDGRLADDAETQRLLDAALATARRYTGWHVSPVYPADVILLDGPGGPALFLPTLKINTVVSVEELGAVIDPATYVVPAGTPNMIYRKDSPWSGEYASITATVDHGYTEAEAADWRQAVLSMVDQMSTGDPGSGELVRKKVGEVEYGWSDSAPGSALHSVDSILDKYCLPTTGFA